MKIRWGPFVALLVLMAAAELRLLNADSDVSFGGVLLGLIAWVVLWGPLAALVWTVAGGDVACAVVGIGRPIWWWRSPAGRTVKVSVLPLGSALVGYAARPGRPARAPFIAMVAWGIVVGLAGAVGMFLATTGFGFGFGTGALLISVTTTLLSKRPGAHLPAALSAAEAQRRTRLTPVALAAGRRDHAALLALTADLPAVPQHWTDTLLLTTRAGALCEHQQATAAVLLLRTVLGGPPDAFTPMVRAALTNVLFEALIRGEVDAASVPLAVDEIRRRTADRDTRTRVPGLEYALKAQLAFLEGDYARATRQTLASARFLPPGCRGCSYALASLASTRAGDLTRARAFLGGAVRDEPNAPLIRPASEALSASLPA